jgi:hypothetical protein
MKTGTTMTLTLLLVMLVFARASTGEETREDTFAPRPFLLASDEAPEVPMPEAGLGEPLPDDPYAAAQSPLTLQPAATTVDPQEEAARRDPDAQFIFLWIAFNEGYATDIDVK